MNRQNKYLERLIILILVLAFPVLPSWGQGPALKALIVTGQNNHDWKTSTPILKQILEGTGLFRVDVATSPEGADGMENFAPNFCAYNVVVLDYTGAPWCNAAQTAFVDYVKNGGGVVVFHAANNAFPEWKEFNEIIGLGGWGDRNEKSGPYIRWRDGQVVRDTRPGPGGNHGVQHAFQVINRDREHPITKGLPEKWMHAKDELYSELRGPAENLKLLATAYSDPKTRGTGEHEPVLFTIEYGKGRIFHTVLGHAGGEPRPPAMQCVGFIVTLQRGAEWAATGQVTQAVPGDFPTESEVRSRRDFVTLSLDALLLQVSAHTFGQSLAAFTGVDEQLREAISKGKPLESFEQRFIEVLNSDATYEGKKFICKKLALIGTAASVPILSKMLMVPETSDIARLALENMPDPAAGQALREALGKTSGNTRVGIITSLGVRREADAVSKLSELLKDADPSAAAAAASALGQIADPAAAKALLRAVKSAPGELRVIMLNAILACADTLCQEGKERKAVAIYEQLYDSIESPVVRGAALRGIVNASGDNAGDIVLTAIKGEDPAMQAVASQAVRELQSPKAVAAIAAELPHLPSTVQIQLLAALGDVGDDAAMPAVLIAADSSEAQVRVAALQALGLLGDGSTVVFLAKRAAMAEGKEAETARASLNRLRAADVDSAIVTAVAAESGKAKLILIRSIADRGITSGTPALIEIAGGSDAPARIEALKALRVVAEPSRMPDLVKLLVTAATDADRCEAVTTAAAVAAAIPEGSGRADAALAALPAISDIRAKCSLLDLLGRIGDDGALPVLIDLLKDQNAEIRIAAIRALSAWPEPAPMKELFAVARKEGGAEGTEALRGYVRLLGLPSDRPVAETVKQYEKALALAKDATEKERVMAGLAATKNEAALPPLFAALKDPDAAVATAAIKALSDWPNDAPLEKLRGLARRPANDIHRVLALRGYVRLIGVNSGRASLETAKMYQEAMTLAPNADEKKMILSGLAGAPSLAALQVAANALQDAALKEEAEVAAVKIAAAVAGSYPEQTKTVLGKVLETAENEFVTKQAQSTLEQLARYEEYITAWTVSGPYTKERAGAAALFDIPFSPEKEGGKQAMWQLIPAGTNRGYPFLIELDKVFSGSERAAYLRSSVWSEKDQDARMEIGSDDGVKVWLNGEVVHANNVIRPNAPNEDKVNVSLKKGWNRLLVKVTQGSGEWSFCLRLRTPEGAKLEGLRAEPGDAS